MLVKGKNKKGACPVVKFRRTSTAGFTLIELMVSVSIFLIVAFVVTSVFITALDAYRKAKQISFLVDNLNFSFERMVINMREGTKYGAHMSAGAPKDNVTFTDIMQNDHTYKLASGVIEECVDGEGCSKLTDSAITIEKLSFVYFPPDMTNDEKASGWPMVRVNARGSITQKTMKTIINLQTTIAQRNPD